jgi:hypothetical protein
VDIVKMDRYLGILISCHRTLPHFTERPPKGSNNTE